MSKARPVPDDFIALAPTLDSKRCKERWKCGNAILKRWKEESGITNAVNSGRVRPAPDNFVQVYGVMTVRALTKLFRCDEKTLRRWATEAGLPVGRGRGQPAPDDLATRSTSYSITGLCSIYSASETTVKRWLRETGVKARPSSPGHFNGPKAAPLPAADNGLSARAAAFLARDTACFPEKAGPHDRKTGAWWWGNLRFATADEMVARAQRKGFRVGGEMVG